MTGAYIVTDLGFGDAGKGTIVDALARRHDAKLVVRHCGGPQAAHNVVLADGRHHTFAQFGSGTFVPGVHSHLSKHMLINPLHLYIEEEHLRSLGIRDALHRLSIHEDAYVITPYHIMANMARERARGDSRHGSCGQGIAECRSDILNYDTGLQVKEFRHGEIHIRERLTEIFALKCDQMKDAGLTREFEEAMRDHKEIRDRYVEACRKMGIEALTDDRFLQAELDGLDPRPVIFEGAQGVLLDEYHGFHPYTTWATTTAQHAWELLAEAKYDGEVESIGVMRAYQTRHGPGPFPTEDNANLGKLVEDHNEFNEWQRGWRVGYTDVVLTRYALDVLSRCVDSLAITHLDKIEDLNFWPIAWSYQMNPVGTLEELPVSDKEVVQPGLTKLLESVQYPIFDIIDPKDFVEGMEERLKLPMSIKSYGPTAESKLFS